MVPLLRFAGGVWPLLGYGSPVFGPGISDSTEGECGTGLPAPISTPGTRVGNPEHGTRIHWMTGSILRTRTLWPACRLLDPRPAGRWPDALRSSGVPFSETKGPAACRSVLRTPGIGLGSHWTRASQLAERPSTSRASRNAPLGMQSCGAQGSESSAGSPAGHFGSGGMRPGFAGDGHHVGSPTMATASL